MQSRRAIKYVITLLCTALTLVACSGSEEHESEDNAGRARLKEAFDSHRIERILEVVDSLEQAGDVTAARAFLLRGYGYDGCWQMRLAEHFYRKAFEAYADAPERNWSDYADAGYRWAFLRFSRCDTEGALGIASDLLTQAEHNPAFPPGTKSALLMLMAECQMQLHHKEAARHTCLQAYEAELEVARKSGGDDFNMSVVCYNIFQNCFETGDYAEAEGWLQRCEQSVRAFEQRGDSGLIEEWKGHLALGRASVLQALGRATEAAAVFDAIPRHRICNPTTISGAIQYLTAAGRYTEAASYYDRLDSTYVATDGAQRNLENIASRMAPRYLATMKAGRTADALAIGADICHALDSAIIWQKKNDAAELAVIYQTHEKDMRLTDLSFRVLLHRLIAVALVVILMLIGYLLWRAHQYNKVLAKKNRHLYEQMQQREAAELEKQRQLQAQPEDVLSTDQQLYRRLCTLMANQQPYTDEAMNRDTLAQLLGTNAKYVDQAIHECSHGETTSAFINRYRLEHVTRLLKTTDDSINLIGEMAGIPSRSTLARLFRNAYGMTCSEYRQMARAQAQAETADR